MEIVDCRIPLSRIGKTVGPSPVQRVSANVRRNGVIVPVLLGEVVGEGGEISYRIIDGNRRVAAARKAGLQDVPARIVIGITDDAAARLTLAANNFRSENDITEFWAIKQLERLGVSRQRIATDAGLTIKSLDLRNRWSILDRRIFVGFANGKISATVARKISRLPREDQQALGDIFMARGRILTDDVDAFHKSKPMSLSVPMHENDMPIAQYPSPDATRAAAIRQRPVSSLTAAPVHQSPASSAPAFQPSSFERQGPEQVVNQSSPMAIPGSHTPAQREAQSEGGNRSGMTMMDPATSKTLHHSKRPILEGLSEDIQRAVDHVARLGCLREVALDDLVEALAIAYRQTEFAMKVTKEAVRG